jgi:hypothetical protein
MRIKGLKSYYKHKGDRLRVVHEYRAGETYLATRQRYKNRPEIKERIRSEVRRRKHHERAAKGYYTETQWQARLDFYERRCYLCGCDWDILPKGDKTPPNDSMKRSVSSCMTPAPPSP